MKPTDTLQEVRLYNCDCMEFMKDVSDKYYDLAIVDPPYGLPKGSTRGAGKLRNRILNKGNIRTWDKVPPQEYFDELFRISGNQIIWGGNYFNLPSTRCVICWDKCQPWENFSQWEMAWTSFDYPASLFKFDNRVVDKIHPTQKPVRLYEWLLNKYAKQGDKILDTCFGSLSIGIACHDLGFSLDACELDKEYYDLAKNRLIEHQRQLKLF
jgi:site-specific DNA-methyltransferase (adenine-specific)